MNPSDILGLGKILPIDKLIDLLSNAVGRISKSYFDRKDAETKAYEIKKLAEARADEMKIIAAAIKDTFQITGGIEYKDNQLQISSPKQLPQGDIPIPMINLSLEDRSNKRVEYQEAKKQLNIENISANAAELLKGEKEVADEPIDEDWTTRFFSIAGEISNEEMQVLWGQILAGEIKHPKSFSLRTLELLRNLTKDEAELFMKLARLGLVSGEFYFIINPDNSAYLTKEYGIKFSDLLTMEDLGLISSAANVELTLFEANEERNDIILHGNRALVLKKEAGVPRQNIKINVFTKVGIELQRLIDKPVDEKYIKKVAEAFKHEKVKFLSGDYRLKDDTTWLVENTKEIKLE